MKVISSPKQALLRACFLLLCLPSVTWAGMKMDNTIEIDQTVAVKVIALIIASFSGGVSSALIPTTFDRSMPYPKVTKIWVGTAIGVLFGLMLTFHLEYGIFMTALPTFVMGSLGAPIMVFYLMWLSSAETQAEIKEEITGFIKSKFGGGK